MLIEEGAMHHVHPITEDLPEGTILVTEQFDSDTMEVVQPKIGDSPHPSTIVTIGSEARRIAGNHVAVYPERLVSYFIQGATDPGDVVLDPFMGTGITWARGCAMVQGRRKSPGALARPGSITWFRCWAWAR